MKRLYIIIFAILTIPFYTSAQSNFVSGYVIKFNGDTIKGMIDNREWNNTPNKIVFKNESESSYKATDILGFGTTNENYKSFKLDVTLNKKNQHDLVADQDPVVTKDTTLFLRFLVKSDYDVYVLVDKNDITHFYIMQGKKPTELVHFQKLITVNQSPYLVENNTFRDQLTEILKADKALAWKIKKMGYYEDEIVNIFKHYNKSKGINELGKQPKNLNERLIDYNIIAGLANSSTSIYYTSGWDRRDYKLNNSASPVIGAGITLYLPRSRRQLSFDNQLFYSNYSLESPKYAAPSYLNAYSLMKYSAQYLKMQNIFRYQYPKGLIRPYVGAGMSFGLLLSSKSTFIGSFLSTKPVPRPVGRDLKSFEPGFAFLLGTTFNRFRLELHNDFGINRINVTYYQLNLCYRLN
ncbi:hypothetical protein NF867_12215 [Solitalea sp. MAHUQ-68]|uniref:Outer membrane protein beta-barrel domain-containing protein n=1 Tax=Solitalea agri TaxID=2953739 RepID=A0A9X2F3L6_9SPHI|nr:hypothetical protein [Solitalea agri]MCO4293631.1 hypothetical protein [Solitalea agri]